MKEIKNFLYFFLFLPVIAYAQVDSSLRDEAMEEALYAMETKAPSSLQMLSSANEKEIQTPKQISIEKKDNNFIQRLETQKNIWWLADDAYLTLGLGFGYLKGNTTYDFNHQTSELEFPMDNTMIGGNFSLGLKNLSFNTEFWTPLESYAGFNMKDKDWTTSGALWSYTKSKAYMDAIIWDANLRYDFYKKEDWASDELKFDKIKIGAVLGYRYERFDYDMYDLWDQIDGTTSYAGQRVASYKIKYYFPYLGMATDFLYQNMGFGMNFKGSFYATAKDVDNHLLGGWTFYGDYKRGAAFICNIYGFWEFIQNWKLKAGVDGTFASIDGRTWEENRDPGWDKDQSTEMRHWIFWSGVEYKF